MKIVYEEPICCANDTVNASLSKYQECNSKSYYKPQIRAVFNFSKNQNFFNY